jgi:hypothetical protein
VAEDSLGWILWPVRVLNGSWGSSVSIMPGYGLDDRRSRFDSWQGQKEFSSSLFVQTSPPSLLSNGYRASFPEDKALPGRDADHLPISSAEVVNE